MICLGPNLSNVVHLERQETCPDPTCGIHFPNPRVPQFPFRVDTLSCRGTTTNQRDGHVTQYKTILSPSQNPE